MCIVATCASCHRWGLFLGRDGSQEPRKTPAILSCRLVCGKKRLVTMFCSPCAPTIVLRIAPGHLYKKSSNWKLVHQPALDSLFPKIFFVHKTVFFIVFAELFITSTKFLQNWQASLPNKEVQFFHSFSDKISWTKHGMDVACRSKCMIKNILFCPSKSVHENLNQS